MEIPLQITARDFDLSDANKANIQKYAEKLDAVYDRIIRCRVVVEALRHRSNSKGLYNIQIVLTVPGSEFVIKREPNEDFHLAVRDAFTAATRRLKDFMERQRGKVKHHEEKE
ncbi:MAG: HPF/RaiA family ribosome-associated protein [Candidatus Brocadiaceae bacterium]|nr:HPF/RaiA family ribosome-associated protein [Candidatus Brocadiaceae bacterium]